MSILGSSIEILIKSICDKLYTNTDTNNNKDNSNSNNSIVYNSYIKQIRELSQSEFQKQFVYYYTDMRRQKLGVYYTVLTIL